MLTPMSGSFEVTARMVEVMKPDITDRGSPRHGLADLRIAICRCVISSALAIASPPQAGYARPELLVDTAWLAQHLTDTQHPHRRHARRAGMATATFRKPSCSTTTGSAIPKAPPTFLPTPQEFEALMSRLGISNTTRVIAYDERGGIYATRLWWILNYYGHSNVALLDGGWVKWAAEQRADEHRDAAAVRARDVQGQARHGEGRDGR